MKVVTWNCKMRFRKEYHLIFPYNPDIVVVPECENLNKIEFDLFSTPPSDVYWIGDNPNKGLGVITFNGLKIKLDKRYSNEYKYILPLNLKSDNEELNLLGVWTQKLGETRKDHINYIRQFKLSMEHYDDFLNHKNVVICGDFNSNLLWKKKKGIVLDRDHQFVLEKLEHKNIISSYHHFFNEEQGKETQPTFYLHHKKEKPFHLDFCFLSKELINRIESVEVGKYEDWIKYSDHVPMIINMD